MRGVMRECWAVVVKAMDGETVHSYWVVRAHAQAQADLVHGRVVRGADNDPYTRAEGRAMGCP